MGAYINLLRSLTSVVVHRSLFCNSSDNFVAAPKQKSSDTQSGTLEKMIVASGSVATDVDLNRLNGIRSRRQS